MSIEIQADVFYLSMPPQRKLILLSLADNSNDQGRCWPSQVLTALKSSLSVRRLRDHLQALEADGWIVKLSTGKGPGMSSHYLLNTNRIYEEASAIRDWIKADKRDVGEKTGDDKREKRTALSARTIIKNHQREESPVDAPFLEERYERLKEKQPH